MDDSGVFFNLTNLFYFSVLRIKRKNITHKFVVHLGTNLHNVHYMFFFRRSQNIT